VDKARTNKSPARQGLDLGRKSTVTIDSITKDIKTTLTGLQDAHRAHSTQLERIEDELHNAQQAAVSMQEQVKDGGDEYSFFAGMKIYVADLLDCMGAKAELVEQAEDKQIAAYRVRTAKNRAYAQRKLEETVKEMKEISEEAAGYGKGPAKARPKPKEEKKRRARGEEEGWSSDSESEEVKREFEKAEADVKDMCASVFEDVDEQYCTIPAIKEKFEKWKKEYSNSYKQAYISLCIPQLFSPFVRLQLLAREPLTAGLETMPWYTDLLAYGIGDSVCAFSSFFSMLALSPLPLKLCLTFSKGEAADDDEDNFLVPRLVEKVVVPHIQNSLSHIWNPQSRTSNARALAAVQELFVYADAFSGNMKELFVGVLGSFQTAVQGTYSSHFFFFPLVSKFCIYC
jgi:GC-rich sequence DNA-binding factor